MPVSCDYAACTVVASAEADGWNFCADHHREHRALQLDEDNVFQRGEGFPIPARPLQPCGTTAAYRRHSRNGERPCAACSAADALRRRPNKSPGDFRRGDWRHAS